jgi:hypothetical protein
MGAAAGSTIIDGQSAGGVISVGSGVIATLNNLTIRNGNNGSGSGGVLNQGTVTLTNVTLSGNTASLGGGMNNNGGAATLTNVTLSGNTASGGGGGIYNNGGTVTLRSGVLAASPCLGTVTSQGANVSDDATCFSTGGTDLANTNPQLGPLANNGGPTVGAPGATSVLQTNALMAGSPAIDYDRRLPAAGDR